MAVNAAELKSNALLALLTVGLFYVAFALMVALNTGIWLVLGRTQSPMGPFVSILFLLSPFAMTWGAIRATKQRMKFAVEYPENAVGGMTIGLAAVLWFSLSALGGLEYMKHNPRGAFGFAAMIFGVTTTAMFTGALCAATFVKRDRSIRMILLSPVVAIASFVIAATLLR